MSEWNSLSGNWTWEERDFGHYALKTLKEDLEGQECELEGDLVLRVSSVSVSECECTVLVLRGRPRVGYELSEVSLTLTVKDKAESSVFSGTLETEEVSNSSGDDEASDFDWSHKSDSGSFKQEFGDAAKTLLMSKIEELKKKVIDKSIVKKN